MGQSTQQKYVTGSVKVSSTRIYTIQYILRRNGAACTQFSSYSSSLNGPTLLVEFPIVFNDTTSDHIGVDCGKPQSDGVSNLYKLNTAKWSQLE